jgi:CBS domain-containing protein
MICPTCGHDNLPGAEVCGNCQQDLSPLDRPCAENRVERRLVEDQVQSLTARPPATLPATATVREAIDAMLAQNTGAVLVVDDRGSLLGIFSERDLLKKVAGVINDYAELPIGRFMTQRPETVTTTDTLNFVLHKMDGGGYRHVPVLEAGRPVSMLSVRDMLKHLTRLCRE